MDNESSENPRALSASRISRSLRKGTRWDSKSSLSGGIAINPRNRSRGSSLTACASSGTSDGAAPDLLPSPATFTSMQTFKGESS
jgi:hypothetical protein